jgi:hypothetical protein
MTTAVDLIDKKIKNLVVALNDLGVPTTGSCEGHTDHGSPAPWIKITPPAAADPARIQKTVSVLLDSFYRNHIPEKDARFVMEDAKRGFWIHNGGEDYLRWREGVNRTAQKPQITVGAQHRFTAEEIRQRAAMLPVYQREILFFTKFLTKELRPRSLR